MRLVKLFGLAAIAAAALMAFAGSASATVLTGTGCAETGCAVGTEVKAELKEGEAILKSNFIGEVKCQKLSTAGQVTNAGSATTTVALNVTSLTLTSCNCVVAVLKTGTLEIHTEGASANGNGTVTGTGQEFTIECSGFHCIFTTSNTDLGQMVGGTPGVLRLNATIPRTGGRSGALCGTSGNFIGVWRFTTPSTISID